jgi:hypothetical protein
MTAGRRRKGRKTRKTGRRKTRGGALFGVNQSEPIAVGAASVGPADDGKFYDSATGQPRTGGRRKLRKSRRRQRGGASGVTVGKVYASFDGSGERGIAHAIQGVHPGNKF